MVKLLNCIGFKAITVNAPKLKSLSIIDSSVKFISFSNVIDLVSISITLKKSVQSSHKGRTHDMIKTLSNWLFSNYFHVLIYCYDD